VRAPLRLSGVESCIEARDSAATRSPPTSPRPGSLKQVPTKIRTALRTSGLDSGRGSAAEGIALRRAESETSLVRDSHEHSTTLTVPVLSSTRSNAFSLRFGSRESGKAEEPRFVCRKVATVDAPIVHLEVCGVWAVAAFLDGLVIVFLNNREVERFALGTAVLCVCFVEESNTVWMAVEGGCHVVTLTEGSVALSEYVVRVQETFTGMCSGGSGVLWAVSERGVHFLEMVSGICVCALETDCARFIVRAKSAIVWIASEYELRAWDCRTKLPLHSVAVSGKIVGLFPFWDAVAAVHEDGSVVKYALG
jgi:hypothetical protein